MKNTWCSFVLLQLLAFLLLSPVEAGDRPAPAPMEVMARWSLDEVIVDIGFFSDSRFVYTLSAGNQPTLRSWLLEDLERDPRNTDPVATVQLSGGRDFQIIAYGTGLISLVDQERRLEISRHDVNLQITSQKQIEVDGDAQRMTTLLSGLIVIPLLQGRETSLLSFTTKDGLAEQSFERINQPIESTWYDPRTKSIFANSLAYPSFYVTQNGNSNGAVLGYSGRGYPYLADLRHLTVECSKQFDQFAQPIVLADYSLGMVNAVTFQSSFAEFEVNALVQIRPERGSEKVVARENDFRVPESPLLLTASCDRSRILFGATFSKEVIQMSYNPAFEVLDVIEQTTIDIVPDYLAVSTTGERALAASRSTGQIRILAEPIASELTEDQRTISAARDIQRVLTVLGYPIGTIDGKIGPRTNRALDLFQEDLKIELPRNDISKLAKKIRELAGEEIPLLER